MARFPWLADRVADYELALESARRDLDAATADLNQAVDDVSDINGGNDSYSKKAFAQLEKVRSRITAARTALTQLPGEPT